MRSFALYLLVFFIFAFAGEILTWEKQYDSGYYDEGKKIITLNDGSFLIGARKTHENSNQLIWLMNINSVGDTLWTKTIGTDAYASDWILNDIATNNSNIYLAYTFVPIAGVRGHLSLKDSLLNDIWDVTFPAYGMMASSTKSFECTPDSGCIISWREQTSLESSTGHLEKYNKDGNFEESLDLSELNNMRYTISNEVQGFDYDINGNYFVVGSITESDSNHWDGSYYSSHSYILKCNNSLDTLWYRYDYLSDRSLNAIKSLSNGNCLISTSNSIVMINSEGDSIKTSDTLSGGAHSIISTIDGNFLAVGSNGINKLDPDLNIIWSQDYGCYDLVATNDGGFLATGRKNDNIWIYKMDENGDFTSINPDQSGIIDNFSLEQNYPNPFNNATIIPYNLYENSDVKINIYNAKGEMVWEVSLGKQNKGAYNYQLNANALTAGIYYYCLLIDGKAVDNKKMLFLK